MKSRLNVPCLSVLPLLLCFFVEEATALPTMIRLGYPTCSSCHITPQGGGLLNMYGKSIDQAQSFIGGEYSPSDNPFIKFINAESRITQDFRIVMQQQDVSTTSRPGTQIFRSRFIYRNATELGKGFRITATITGENESARRPTLSYEPPVNSSQTFVNTALISYRARPTLEFAVGRDQLPTGVNIPDLSFFIRSRNRLGYYDAPTQAKVFWWNQRMLVTPYLFVPGGNERSGQHEAGEGLLAEVDVLGKQKTVAGMNVLHGVARLGDRTMLGPYARLGFGKWGILMEQDLTKRTLKTGTYASFWQAATYGQLFWAVKEWLVPSLIYERLSVNKPYEERLDALRIDLAARLTPQLTISAGPRIQRDEISGRIARSVVFQLAFKTIH